MHFKSLMNSYRYSCVKEGLKSLLDKNTKYIQKSKMSKRNFIVQIKSLHVMAFNVASISLDTFLRSRVHSIYGIQDFLWIVFQYITLVINTLTKSIHIWRWRYVNSLFQIPPQKKITRSQIW